MTPAAAETPPPAAMAQRVRQAVIWRSGSQIVAQAIAWGSTFLVIRLLDPQDYGLFAMAQVMLVFLNVMNGYGMASALIRAETVSQRQLAQMFGLLLLLNFALAAVQFMLAPWAAAYYRQPMVADLLRVQALLYLLTPFTALAHAILSRRMDFKRPAQVRLSAGLAGAATALACASAGMGVWTLVAAPMALFGVEAVGMTWAARSLIRPSFRFDEIRPLVRFGAAMTLAQLFWFIQSQADIFIAGRWLDPHQLGLYSTALFLTQILASKFVPPLNEVAFAAYSRIQSEGEGALGEPFVRTVRLVLLLVLPAYAGFAVVAEPLVATMLGEKWLELSGLLPILAVAMSLMTLQILFAPAANALGRPDVTLRTSIAGALLLPCAFLIGIQSGVQGLAWAWAGGMALLLLVTARLALPVIGIGVRRLVEAAAPVAFAAIAMALLVHAAGLALPTASAPLRLALLAGTGLVAYPLLLALVAPERLREAWQFVANRPPPAGDPAAVMPA